MGAPGTQGQLDGTLGFDRDKDSNTWLGQEHWDSSTETRECDRVRDTGEPMGSAGSDGVSVTPVLSCG